MASGSPNPYVTHITIDMVAMGDPIRVLAALDEACADSHTSSRWARPFAQAVAKQAKEYAPDSRTSGRDQKKAKLGPHLKETIEAKSTGGGGLRSSKMGTWQVSVGEGLDRPYAYFQEMGTKKHPAHPFLRPAVAAVLARNDLSLAKAIWSNNELQQAMITPIAAPVSVYAASSATHFVRNPR